MHRLFFLQPGLVDRRTHYYGEALGWQAACRARGIVPRFYTNRALLPELVAAFSAAPVFAHATDLVIERDPRRREEADFRTVSDSIAAGCAALSADGIGADDVAVVTYASERDIAGVARWLETVAPAQRPAVVFIFHAPSLAWRADDARGRIVGDVAYLRLAMQQLRAVLPEERALLMTPVARLAGALTAALAYPCDVGAMPTYYADDAAAPAGEDGTAEDGARVHFRLAGHFRVERGSEVIVPVMLSIAAERPGTTFAVQASRARSSPVSAADHAAFARHGSVCHVEYGIGDHARYQRRLRHSDILLLPYDGARYAVRSSGAFSEAVGFGIPVVVPGRTWMAECLADGYGAGTIFADFTGDAIAAAAIAALDNHPMLAAQAQQREAAWRSTHSTAALLDQIIGRIAA